MRDRHVAADEIQRQLDNHANTTKPPALAERCPYLGEGFRLEFPHREFMAGNATYGACIPGQRLQLPKGALRVFPVTLGPDLLGHDRVDAGLVVTDGGTRY